MKSFTVDEITQIVGGMLTKVASPSITHIAPPLLCDENTLALALGEEEIANLAKSKAKAALVPLGVQIDGFTTIEVERPRLAMMKLLNLFYVPPFVNKDVHPTAVVDPSAKLGQNVCIGANVVISPDAVIPVSVGIADGSRSDYLYEQLPLLIASITEAGYDIVPVSQVLHD